MQEITPIWADFLVELRGFEPLTSIVQAPARFHRAGASGSVGLTVEGAPLDLPAAENAAAVDGIEFAQTRPAAGLMRGDRF
jgi:hypothetical protein